MCSSPWRTEQRRIALVQPAQPLLSDVSLVVRLVFHPCSRCAASQRHGIQISQLAQAAQANLRRDCYQTLAFPGTAGTAATSRRGRIPNRTLTDQTLRLPGTLHAVKMGKVCGLCGLRLLGLAVGLSRSKPDASTSDNTSRTEPTAAVIIRRAIWSLPRL